MTREDISSVLDQMRFIALLGGILGVGVIALMVRYGTAEPCGILRHTIREKAAREGGGVGGFLATVTPDGLLDGLIAAQYGELSPGRCLTILLGGLGTSLTRNQNTGGRDVGRNTGEPEVDDTIRSYSASPPSVTPPAAAPSDDARETALQQEQNFIAGLDLLVNRMKHFETYADTVLGRIPAAEQRYHAITSQMAEYLRRERSMAWNPRAGAARSQLATAISQGPIATDQAHNQVQPVQWDFENNAVPLMKQVAAAEQACHTAHRATPDNPLPPTADAWNSACLNLLDASARFSKKYTAVAQGLVHVEQVYQRERLIQEQLMNN